MKLTKKILGLMVIAAMSTAMVGCSSDTKVEDSDIVQDVDTEEEATEDVLEMGAEEVYGKILEGVEQTAMLMPMEEAVLNDSYGIDTALLNSYYIMTPMMGLEANEVAVFEVNDQADLEVVEAGINTRVEFLTEIWETYLPEQFELVENHKIATRGNHIIFVIDEHAEEIVDNFYGIE